MKNKRILTLILVVCMVIGLVACGKFTNNTERDKSEENGVNVIQFTDGSEHTIEGDYKIQYDCAEILTPLALSEGWMYYYCEGTDSENRVPWLEWDAGTGNYTICIVANMTNLKDNMEETFLDRFTGYVVYDAPSDFDMSKALDQDYIDSLKSNYGVETYELIPLQYNPGQKDLEGNEIPSVDAVTLDKNVTARQNLRANVPEKVLNSWESGDKKIYAVFGYENNVVYIADLSKDMHDAAKNN